MKEKPTKKSQNFFDKSLTNRHKRLSERLATIAHDDEVVKQSGVRAEEQRKTSSRAMRMASDFISAVVVGGILGYGLDRLLSTQPICLVLFVLLGFAAGILNIMRADKLNRKQQEANDGTDNHI